MTRVMLDGTVEMSKRLEKGIDSFYRTVGSVSALSPEAMWKYVKDFGKPIGFVGPALLCDFLKEIGVFRFVKVDHHFLNEFPRLLGVQDCKTMGEKQHFILSQTVADAVGIIPFYLDRILYEWGRYGDKQPTRI